MEDDVIIKVEHLWKQYGLPIPGIAQRLRNGLRSKLYSKPLLDHWALRDISFEVKKGETLGIIGTNGAGKSTLLKILAGVTPATRGRVVVKGRLSPMIELNAGTHPELTGRENIRLLGAILGLSRSEIEEKMLAIEQFTELGAWLNQTVRKYSSGMMARLGFGVAMNIHADVLLVDEVLAVGDLSFQRRCYDKLGQLRANGVTVVFVSHALRQVERLCERVILLNGGEMDSLGESAEIVNYYYSQSTAAVLEEDNKAQLISCVSSGEVSLQAIDMVDDNDNVLETLQVGTSLTIRIVYNAHETLTQPIIAISILTSDFMLVTNFSTDSERDRPNWSGGGSVDCHIPDLRLLPGIYYLRIIIRRKDGFKCFKAERAKVFRVVSENGEIHRSNLGIFQTKVLWKFKNDG